MHLNVYQDQSGLTAIYPGKNTTAGLIYTILGLASEAGELAGKMKKVLRDNDGAITCETRQDMSDELGDILWYVQQTASELGYNLGDIAHKNLRKLQDRKLRNTLHGSGDHR